MFLCNYKQAASKMDSPSTFFDIKLRGHFRMRIPFHFLKYRQIFRTKFLALMMASGLVFGGVSAQAADFELMAKKARGQTVYFNAWGGSPQTNSYIAWAGSQIKSRYGVTLVHVKLTETADAVARILAEKLAGKTRGGSVDLVWVNGENFASLKRQGLLRSDSWAFALPSFAYTDAEALPGIISDFANPTDGLESPWGRAQLVFGYDTQFVPNPPRSAEELANWIEKNPGRFTFPQPPDFTGTSFLKQILLEVSPDKGIFAAPASEADTKTALAPLFSWLDRVRPHLWRGGVNYPPNYTSMVQLLGDGELAIAMAFNPAEFSNGISQGILPDSVRTYIHDAGTLANVHFVAIPFNASAADGAQVVANFLLSPEAQIRKANPELWGDPTVLSIPKLDATDAKAFADLPRGMATLSPADLNRTLPEPHPSWVGVIERAWMARYSAN